MRKYISIVVAGIAALGIAACETGQERETVQPTGAVEQPAAPGAVGGGPAADPNTRMVPIYVQPRVVQPGQPAQPAQPPQVIEPGSVEMGDPRTVPESETPAQE